MMTGKGPFGPLEMGGMFTVVKVRDNLAPGAFADPGWYRNPAGTVARRVSNDPEFGNPARPSRRASTTSPPMHRTGRSRSACLRYCANDPSPRAPRR
jgi:hypothetical protein